MPDVIIIDLPLPPRALQPNARVHWGSKARDTKRARQRAADEAVLAGRPKHPFAKANLHATFTFKKLRTRDGDNLNAWLKAYRDGLADARIVANDNDITNLPPAVIVDKTAKAECVVLRIERTE